MIDDPLVTIEHIRAANLCSRGAKHWFARNNLDFRVFLTEGMPASVIESTNDALGLKVAAIARAAAAQEDTQ